jgi:hypothetical protein
VDRGSRKSKALVEAALTTGDGLQKVLVERLGVSPKHAALLESAVTGLAGFLEEQLQEDHTALDDEKRSMEAVMRLVGPVVQSRLQRRLETLDGKPRNEAVRCIDCNKPCRSIGMRDRKFRCLGGAIVLHRRVVECTVCPRHHAPSERAMGLGAGDFTPRLEELCTMHATTVSHEMATYLLKKTIDLDVSPSGLQRLVERRGQVVEAQNEQEAVEQRAFLPDGTPRRLPAVPGVVGPQVAYLEVDGVVPMTRELVPEAELTSADKAKKIKAKLAKTPGGAGCRYRLQGREVKNAVMYAADACALLGETRGALLDKRYVSYLGESGVFTRRVWAAMRARGYDQAKTLVILSDGAEWIRTLAGQLPVEKVVLVLDLFHAKHRVWEVANAAFGEGTTEARAWADEQNGRIEAGRAADVVNALRFMKPGRRNAAELIDALSTYITNNLDRMDYPTYIDQGFRIGSGAVESANYHVTGARLKLQGMRWSVSGAAEMASLRADLFNDRWEARTRAILRGMAA